MSFTTQITITKTINRNRVITVVTQIPYTLKDTDKVDFLRGEKTKLDNFDTDQAVNFMEQFLVDDQGKLILDSNNYIITV